MKMLEELIVGIIIIWCVTALFRDLTTAIEFDEFENYSCKERWLFVLLGVRR